MQLQNHRTRFGTRRGNMLVGCLSVLAVVLVLAIIATIFVMRSYRGWIATGIEKAVDTALIEMQIDDAEQSEIQVHVQTLMTKYTSKQISNEQLGEVFETLIESPLVAAAVLGGIDKLYFVDSELSDEEKAAARVQLRRYANGLFDETIDPNTLETVLASVSTSNPDDNDIVIQHQFGSNGTSQYALRSADEVSDDELRELVAQAQAKADEAGIEANPPEVDLSDTLGVALAQALGEDPTLWVPGYIEPSEPAELPEPDAPTDAPKPDDEP